MAARKFSLPIIFAVMLLFPLVFGRTLEERPSDRKDADLKNIDETKSAYGYHPGDQLPDGFNDDKQYGCGRPGYRCGYKRPPPCYHRCPPIRPGYRCCSDEEYAEFVKSGN